MRKKITFLETIDCLNQKLSQDYELYMRINHPEEAFSGPIVIDRKLRLKEQWTLRLEQYKEIGGWRLLGRAHLLKNSCPHCGHQLYLAHQTSPAWTWGEMCGREGYLVYCPHCKKEIQFFLTIMN